MDVAPDAAVPAWVDTVPADPYGVAPDAAAPTGTPADADAAPDALPAAFPAIAGAVPGVDPPAAATVIPPAGFDDMSPAAGSVDAQPASTPAVRQRTQAVRDGRRAGRESRSEKGTRNYPVG
jgi:hypothetical protein